MRRRIFTALALVFLLAMGANFLKAYRRAYPLHDVRSVMFQSENIPVITESRIKMPVFRRRASTVLEKIKYWYEDTFVRKPSPGPFDHFSGGGRDKIRIRFEGDSERVSSIVISVVEKPSEIANRLKGVVSENFPGLSCKIVGDLESDASPLFEVIQFEPYKHDKAQ